MMPTRSTKYFVVHGPEKIPLEATRLPPPLRGCGALRCMAIAALLFVLSPIASMAASTRFFFAGDGHIEMQHGHFKERLSVRYRNQDGTYDAVALQQIRHFFRSREDGAEGEVSLRLIELLDFIEDSARPKSAVLMSGYRSPEFNEAIRGRGARAAQASLHTEGLAADVHFNGIDLKKLWLHLREEKVGGVGFYRKEGFLHVDTGRPRFWEPQTSKVEQNISRGNAKVFARTDFDRYASIDGAVIILHSVTLLPLRIAREARIGAQTVALEPLTPGVRDDNGCWLLDDVDRPYQFRIRSAATLVGRKPVRLFTCDPRLEATPEEFETNEIEAVR